MNGVDQVRADIVKPAEMQDEVVYWAPLGWRWACGLKTVSHRIGNDKLALDSMQWCLNEMKKPLLVDNVV